MSPELAMRLIGDITRSTIATLRRHAEDPRIAEMSAREVLLLEADTMELALKHQEAEVTAEARRG